MKISWDDYFAPIVMLPASFNTMAEKPTDEDINLYEDHIGFRFPLTYRAFIKLLGPGRLASDYRIVTPYRPTGEKACHERRNLKKINLQCFNLDLRTDGPLRPEVLPEYEDPEALIPRLVFFSENSAGDFIGWDPRQLVDPEALEYATYLVLGEEQTIRFLTNSFFDFIDTTCYDNRANLTADPARNREEHYVFQPASYPPD